MNAPVITTRAEAEWRVQSSEPTGDGTTRWNTHLFTETAAYAKKWFARAKKLYPNSNWRLVRVESVIQEKVEVVK